MLSQLFSDPLSLIFWIIALLVTISIHEFAHALAADKLGDPTPQIDGRLTLNPLAHLDPVGTILLPLLLLITGSPIIFGWGKPVPIDSFNFRNPRRDMAITSLAGPASNFVFAIILSVFLRLTGAFQIEILFNLTIFSIIVSVAIGLFNLIPIPPLDGSKILLALVSPNTAYKIEKTFSQYGLILLAFLIFPFFGFSIIGIILNPIFQFILNILLP